MKVCILGAGALGSAIGDTLRLGVGAKRGVKRPGWGIVILPSELINQRDEVVRLGEHRLLIPRRPADAAA